MKDFRSYIDDYLNKKEKHKKQFAAVVSLSMLITFSVPMILQEPAISQTKDSFSPVGDILSAKLFNASQNMLENYAKESGNIVDGIVYSPEEMSEVALLIGNGSNLAQGAASAADVIANAKRKYFLGIASDFCVFLENDFTPKDADAEGRVAVGGNVRYTGPWSNYQVGAGDFQNSVALKHTDNYEGVSDFAHLIMGGEIMQTISPYGTTDEGRKLAEPENDLYKRFVVYKDKFNNDESFHKIHTDSETKQYENGGHDHFIGSWDNLFTATSELSQFYVAQTPLIDFADAFSHIRGQADKLKVIKTTNGGSAVWNDSKLTCTVPEGCQDKTVYFTLDEWHDPTEINFVNIPTYVDNDGKEKLANIIINCGGENIEIGRVTNGIEININETTISKEGTGKNNHKCSENILWNFYEATELYIDANFNGTILSPNADAKSEDSCNGHLSGSLIAKSFEGGLEFGYRPYRGTVDILGTSNGYVIPFDKFIKGTNKERLAGATFGVYDGENLLTTFTSGQDTEFVNLPSKVDFGKSEENAEFTTTYTIKEISAPDGFVLDDITEYTVIIKEKVLDGIFDGSEDSSGSGAILTGRPSEVEAVVSISSNKAEYKEQEFSIHLKDIWSYDVSSGNDKIIRRELVVDNEIFYLNLDNGKIVSVMKKEGEPLSTGTAVVTRASLVSVETSTEYDTDIPLTTELTDAEGNVVTDEDGSAHTSVVTTQIEKVIGGDPMSEFTINKINFDGDVSGGYELTFYYNDPDKNKTISGNSKSDGLDLGDLDKNGVIGLAIKFNDTVSGNNFWIQETGNGHAVIFGTSYGQWKQFDAGQTYYYPNEISPEIRTTSLSVYDSTVTTVITTVSDYITSSNTTEVINFDMYPTIIADPDNPSTYPTTVADAYYRYDPDSMMMMPLPEAYPSFENDFGLIFQKTDGEGNALTGATIALKEVTEWTDNIPTYSNVEGMADILSGGSSVTIDLDEIHESKLYCFVETDAPANYEIAAPIFIKKNGSIIYCTSDAEKAKSGNTDGWETVDVKQNAGENKKVVNMTDIKISGAKLKLEKIDTDSNKKINGATFQLYSSKDELIYPVGDNETFKIENGEIDLFNLLRENSERCNPDYVQKGYLKVGSYYLKEITPPADYEIQGDGKFGFRVKNDYSIEAVAAGTSNYISADINSTESSKQIWVYPVNSNKEKISVLNVTKIEIELNSPQSGTIVVYECNPLNGKTASIVDGIATFDNLSNISFDKMKLQNTSYDSGLDVKEIRIYGEEGSGSGSSSDSAYNIEQIAWNDDKSHNSTIELTFYYSDKEPQTKTVNVSGNTWWYKFDIDGNLNKENVVGIKINSKDSEWGKIKIKANDDKDVFGTDQDKWIGPGETSFGDTSGNFNSSTGETQEEPTKPTESENLAVNVTEDGIIQIPNRKAGDEISVIVNKKWAYDEGFETDLRPTEIKVKLERYFADGIKDDNFVSGIILLKEENNWTNQMGGFERTYTENGEEKTYIYKAVEIIEGSSELENYVAPTYLPDGFSSSNTIEITNTLKTIDINAEKKWIDGNGNAIADDSLLPTEVQVKLQYRKSQSDNWTDVENRIYILTKDEDWKTTIEKLPEKYEYRIVEMSVPNGWEVQTVEDTAKSDDLSTSVTNKRQTGNLEIEKNWENDTDSDRPKNLTIGLYRTTKVPASTVITPDLEYDDYSNYAKLLQYSLYFYDANMCGSQVGETSAYSWRDDCHTYNEVDGGFHDAGDHLMLGLPQGFTASTLGWNYYEFKDAFDSLGQTEHYQTIMKYFCDFFVNSVHYSGNNVSEILVQKGSEGGNQRDHDYWGNPENQAAENYGKETWISSGASNIAAEYAAALASYAVNFPDDSNSATYLNTAKALYEFSKKSDGVWNAEGLYSDKNCDDERAWAAAWLYLATNDNSYREDCKSKLNSNIDERGHFWGEPMLGAATLYASHIDKNDSDAKKIVTDYLSSKATGDSYAVLNGWGSARHNTLLQTVALSATKNFDDVDYIEWCANQMGMILGNNTKNICLVVGFADNSATSPHHRAASNFVRTDPEWKDYNSWSGRYSDVEGSHILVGALCGGPGSSDFNTYNDSAKDATSNEVTIDYNAGLVGAAAGLYYFTGKGTTDTFDEINAASGNELKNVYNETPVNVKVYKNIEVNENETLVLKTGDEGKLVLENSENKTVEWIDSVDSVVKVENGILTVLDEGTAIITAKIDGINKTFNINVQIASIIPDVSEMEHIQDITEFNKNTNNKWTANVNNLPIYSPNGQKYYYYIKENYTGADGRTVAGRNGTYYSVRYTNGVELVNSETVKADVTNEKVETGGATMPSAGGNGTRNYYFAGAFIIGMAGAFWIIKRRKFAE